MSTRLVSDLDFRTAFLASAAKQPRRSKTDIQAILTSVGGHTLYDLLAQQLVQGAPRTTPTTTPAPNARGGAVMSLMNKDFNEAIKAASVQWNQTLDEKIEAARQDATKQPELSEYVKRAFDADTAQHMVHLMRKAGRLEDEFELWERLEEMHDAQLGPTHPALQRRLDDRRLMRQHAREEAEAKLPLAFSFMELLKLQAELEWAELERDLSKVLDDVDKGRLDPNSEEGCHGLRTLMQRGDEIRHVRHSPRADALFAQVRERYDFSVKHNLQAMGMAEE